VPNRWPSRSAVSAVTMRLPATICDTRLAGMSIRRGRPGRRHVRRRAGEFRPPHTVGMALYCSAAVSGRPFRRSAALRRPRDEGAFIC
jgi:hypothetical protein